MARTTQKCQTVSFVVKVSNGKFCGFALMIEQTKMLLLKTYLFFLYILVRVARAARKFKIYLFSEVVSNHVFKFRIVI